MMIGQLPHRPFVIKAQQGSYALRGCLILEVEGVVVIILMIPHMPLDGRGAAYDREQDYASEEVHDRLGAIQRTAMRKETLLREVKSYSRKKLSSGKDYVEAVSLASKGLADSFLCLFWLSCKRRSHEAILW